MKKNRLIICFLLLLFLTNLQAQENKTDHYTIKSIPDIVYKKIDGKDLKLNLFLPVQGEKQREKAPLLISISSGCWYSGKPGNGGFWRSCRSVEKGFAIADVSHRSVGDGFAFPSQIEDVKAAVRFLRAHAKEYNLDPDRFAAMGFSSGGHLASMLGIPNKYRLFDVGENLDYSSQVQCVINFYSPSNIPFMLKNSPKHSVNCIYMVLGAKKIDNQPLSDQAPDLMEIAQKCSPITYVDQDFSPTLTIQGLKDTTVPASQSCMFAEALQRAKVRSAIYIGNNGVHSRKSIAPDDILEKMIFDFLEWK